MRYKGLAKLGNIVSYVVKLENVCFGSKNLFDLIQQHFLAIGKNVPRAAKLENICVRSNVSATMNEGRSAETDLFTNQ